MNRYILTFAFFAVLLALATSANAQECSQTSQPTKTWNQQPVDPLCTGSLDVLPFTVYSTTVDSCINGNTGAVYLQSVRQVTGIGYWNCGLYHLYDTKCNPTITQEVTHATSPTDYNRFYLRAWDADPTIQAGMVCAILQPMARQDFWQCIGVHCSTSGTGCGKGGGGTCGSPIILDLSGNGFALTDASNGVKFDLDGTGTPVQMGWTASGADNAFLALPGADGLVHNGKQLFGNFTPQPQSATPNGFAALAVYDDPKNSGNGDGIIDSHDAVFASLRLWIDANHDGISQPAELHTLPSLGINSLSLKYKESERTDQYGNVFRFRAPVNSNDPASPVARTAYDVFFVVLPPPVAKSSPQSCPIPKAGVTRLTTK